MPVTGATPSINQHPRARGASCRSAQRNPFSEISQAWLHLHRAADGGLHAQQRGAVGGLYQPWTNAKKNGRNINANSIGGRQRCLGGKPWLKKQGKQHMQLHQQEAEPCGPLGLQFKYDCVCGTG